MDSPTSAVQLLVEGTSPKGVLEVLCTSWNLLSIEIRDFRNVENLRTYLETFVRTRGFLDVTDLGIIRDAERSSQSAFQSVQHSLRNAGLDVPEFPGESSRGAPAVSVLILPDSESEGNLESLLWRSVQEEPEARCVHEFLGCLNLGDVDITRRDKARVQAYLASKPRPHGAVSVAAKRGHWDPQHRAFSQLRRFLLNLHAGRSDR